MDNEEPTMDNDQGDWSRCRPRTTRARSRPTDDDSDAPIKLDDLGPEMAEEAIASDVAESAAESVAVGPGTETVRAETVTVSQASAGSIEASNVSINQVPRRRVSSGRAWSRAA